MRRSLRARRLVPGLALALLAACSPPGERTAAESAGPTGRTYEVRGILRAVPDPDTGTGQLRIRHEAIPDLVGQSGEIEAMAAMTMPFPVAADLDLAGFTVGDAVRFELRVDWAAERPVVVTAVERLPDGTELDFD